MQWIHNYQLFLFDFDGLLVNTEEIHYLAYIRMLANRGFQMPWTFQEYCRYAHYTADGFQKALFSHFPILNREGIVWQELYREKTQALKQLYEEDVIGLMPGVREILLALDAAKIKSCVVTHSAADLVKAIRKQIKELEMINHWITREDYTHPKPHPDCYQKAIQMYAADNDCVIGFEDTPRGVCALRESRAQPVIISKVDYPEIVDFKNQGIWHFESFYDAFNG